MWEDHRNGEGADIYAWDPCDEEEFPVSAAEGDQTDPAVYGTVVLWADHRSGDWDIYGSDAGDLWIDWAEATGPGSRVRDRRARVRGDRGLW